MSENPKYLMERNIGHFALARSLSWPIIGALLVNFFTVSLNEDQRIPVFRAFYYSMCYVIFVLIAYAQLIQGLKYNFSKKLIPFMVDSAISCLLNLACSIYFLVEFFRSSSLINIEVIANNFVLIFINVFSCKKILKAFKCIASAEKKINSETYHEQFGINPVHKVEPDRAEEAIYTDMPEDKATGVKPETDINARADSTVLKLSDSPDYEALDENSKEYDKLHIY